MGTYVHARLINGEMRFRLWETMTDTYVTGPMSRQEAMEFLTGNLKVYLLNYTGVSEEDRTFATDPKYDEVHEKFAAVLRSPFSDYPMSAERRLEQAAKMGSDPHFGERVPLDSPWKPQIHERSSNEDE